MDSDRWSVVLFRHWQATKNPKPWALNPGEGEGLSLSLSLASGPLSLSPGALGPSTVSDEYE